MASENKTKYAILGVLNMRPASGYDIKKYCDQSISYFWNENYGHIYPVLKQMERDEWIVKDESVHKQEGKRNRNVYRITDLGKQALHKWLLSKTELGPARYEFLLKMFFSDEIPVKITLDRLRELKACCEKEWNDYKEIEIRTQKHIQEMDPEDKSLLYRYSTLRFGILNIKSIVDWCTETINTFEQIEERSDLV